MEKTITQRSTVYETNWFSLVAKTVNGEQHPFYSLETLDYVTVLAVTQQQHVLLVRQYRPAVERYTLELPSGHVDPGETPEDSARRELLEETGYQADTVEHLGTLIPDSGQLANRLWCYFAGNVQRVTPAPELEAGITLITCTLAELESYIAHSQFDHALHLAVILLALSQRKLAMGPF